MIFTLWHNVQGLAFGKGERDFILADGYFVADIADKFEQFLKDNPPSDVHAIVALNSPGPLVSSGLGSADRSASTGSGLTRLSQWAFLPASDRRGSRRGL